METNEPKITIEECMEAFAYYTRHSDYLLILGRFNSMMLRRLAESNNLNYKFYNPDKILEIINLQSKKGIVRFNIQAYEDREKVISGLANSGYHVWVEEKKENNSTKYYVCYER